MLPFDKLAVYSLCAKLILPTADGGGFIFNVFDSVFSLFHGSRLMFTFFFFFFYCPVHLFSTCFIRFYCVKFPPVFHVLN